MRQKIIALTLAVASIFLISGPFGPGGSVHAASVTYYKSDGIVYYISGGEAYVTDYVGTKKSLKIPQTLGGKYVVYVELCGYEGSALDLTACTKLRNLYTEGLYVKSLDLSKCTALERLTLDESGIGSVNISNCPKLISLLIYSSKLSALDVSKNVKLVYLRLFYTPITKLDLSKNTTLCELTLYRTGLTSLNLAANGMLTKASISNNSHLKSVVNSPAPAMKKLSWS